MLSQEQFVDLYELLGVAPDTDSAAIRQQINKLYTEAQRNLDHHNFRKRFYYQELFEVHLPLAHKCLLTDASRAEYDRCLDAFKKGEPLPDLAAAVDTRAEAREGLPAMRDGEAPATSRVSSLPSRDLTGGMLPNQDTVRDVLPSRGDELLPATTSAPAPAAPHAGAPPVAKAPTPPAVETGALPAPPSSARPVPAPTAVRPEPAVVTSEPEPGAGTINTVTDTKPWRALPADEVERRRDNKRRELIRAELEAAGRAWGIIAGCFAFAIMAGAAIMVMNLLSQSAKATGLTIMLVIAAGISSQVGMSASRSVRRKVVSTLSKMPYDELLRRCAG